MRHKDDIDAALRKLTLKELLTAIQGRVSVDRRAQRNKGHLIDAIKRDGSEDLLSELHALGVKRIPDGERPSQGTDV